MIEHLQAFLEYLNLQGVLVAKKLNTDIPTFDHDLDFDFDTDISGDLNQESKKTKNRGVVTSVAIGALEGAKDTLTSANFVKKTLEKALPRTYGEITEGLGDAASTAFELYDQSVKELKPRIASITRKVDQLVPEGQKTMKGITGKILDWTGGRQSSSGSSAAAQEDQAVATALGAIFQQNHQYTQMAEKVADKKEILKENILRKRHSQEAGLLASINQNTSFTAQYTTNVTQAYQKKMLELSLRGYMSQKEHYANNMRFNQMFQAQLEGIVKNTAMPEFLKITASERFMDISKNRFFNSLYGEGSLIKRGMEKVKKAGTDYVSGLSMALENADMQLDQMVSAKEMIDSINESMIAMGEKPMSKAQIMGAMAGGSGVEFLRDRLIEPVRKRLAEHKPVTEGLAKLARFTRAPGTQFQKLQDTEKWQQGINDYDSLKGTFMRILDAGADMFKEGRPGASFAASTDLDDLKNPTMGFDQKAHITLVDVIPGYLSAITRELTMARTGSKDVPFQTYDFSKKEFVTRGEMGNRIFKDLQNEAQNSRSKYEIDVAAKDFAGDTPLTEMENFELKIFFSRLARITNMEYTPENIRSTSVYKNLSKNVRQTVDAKLDDIDFSDDKEVKLNELDKSLMGIRAGFPSMEKTIDKYVKAGYGKEIANKKIKFVGKDGQEKERGIVYQNEDGDYVRDEEAYAHMLEQEGISKSDINVKQAIKQIKPTDLLREMGNRLKDGAASLRGKKDYDYSRLLAEKWKTQKSPGESRQSSVFDKWNPKKAYDGIRKTKLFSWKYKPGEGDTDEHMAPMAQDLNRNLGEEAAPTGKKVDLVSMNGAAMAGIQHLGERFDAFKKSLFGSNELESNSGKPGRGSVKTILQAIRKDVHAIASRKGTGSGTGIGAGDQNQNTGDYASLLGTTVKNVTDLAVKVGQDVFGAASRIFTFGKDKVATPVIDYVKNIANDKNHPVRKGLSAMFEKATALAGSALDFGKDMVNKHLPAGWDKIAEVSKKAYEEIAKRITEAKDLYLPGGTEPVIRAIKLKTGFYRDGDTGEPVFTMDKLLAIKGDIIDKAGNVIVSAEEKAQGLIDRHGDRVKSVAMTLLSGAVGAAFALKDKALQGFSAFKENGMKLFGKAKGWLSGKTKDFSMDGFGGSGKFAKLSHGVLVDIRDILLGRKAAVIKRMKKMAAAEKADKDLKDQQAATGPADTTMGSIGGYFSDKVQFAKDYVKKLKEDKDSGKLKEKMDSLKETGKSKLTDWKSKLGDLKTKASEKFDGLKEAGDDKLAELKEAGAGKLAGLKGGKAGSWLGAAFGKLKEKGKRAGDALSSKLKGNKEEKDYDYQKLIADKWKLKSKGGGADGDGDEDDDGIKDGSVKDRSKKLEALKASRTKKTADADLTVRYKSEEGYLGKLMAGVGGLFKMMTSGLSGIFGLAGGLISKIPGFGKLLGGAGGLLGKTGNLATKATGGGLLKTVGRGAMAGAKVLGKAAVFTAARVLPLVAGGLLSVAGTAASVVGSIIGSPVILGAIATAAVGYGIYKLYKYANRNNANDYERIRLQQYGFGNSTDQDQYNNVIYMLEAYLEDGKISYDHGTASLNTKVINSQDLLNIFKIDKDDTEQGEKFASWFQNRFKPVFLTHMTALFSADPKGKLGDVHKLPAPARLKYLEATAMDGGPYGLLTGPLAAMPELPDTKAKVKESVKILMERLQQEIKSKAKDVPLPQKAAGKVSTPSANQDYANKAREQEEKARLEKDKAAATKAAAPASSLAAPVMGEDGPKPQTPPNLQPRSQAPVPSSLPLAKGAPLEGTGGMQFLNLGKGVNVDRMHPGTLKLLLGMAEEYGKATGKSIQVNDGFRSYEKQAALHRQYPDKAAPPGRSLHEFGIAVDINSADADALEKLGLMKKYGFTRPVGGEPWHMEPAGVQRNIDLARKDARKRDLMVDSSMYRGGGGYGSLKNSTKYRRNNDMAQALLDLPGKVTAAASLDKNESIVSSVSMPRADAVGTSGLGGKDAANSPVMVKKPMTEVPNREQSASKNLPTEQELAYKQQAATGDQEAKPKDTTADASGKGGDVREIIEKNAKRAGMDPKLMVGFAAVESDMNPRAKSSGSAAGLFQFMPATWKEQMAKHGDKYSLAKDASPYDPEAATLLASEYLKSNQRSLSSVKKDQNITDAYLTHLLGAGGARTFLSANPRDVAANVVDRVIPGASRSNPSVFYTPSGKAKSVKEAYDDLTVKLQKKARSYGVEIPAGNLPNAGKTEAAPAASSPPQPSAPAQAPESTVAKAATGREMIPAASNSGVFVDRRGSSLVARERRESGEAMAGPSMAGIESRLDKSVGIWQDQLDVLKDILVNVKTETVANAIAAAVASAVKGAANDKPSMKEQDKANMGRKNMSPSSSLDFSRKSA